MSIPGYEQEIAGLYAEVARLRAELEAKSLEKVTEVGMAYAWKVQCERLGAELEAMRGERDALSLSAIKDMAEIIRAGGRIAALESQLAGAREAILLHLNTDNSHTFSCPAKSDGIGCECGREEMEHALSPEAQSSPVPNNSDLVCASCGSCLDAGKVAIHLKFFGYVNCGRCGVELKVKVIEESNG